MSVRVAASALVMCVAGGACSKRSQVDPAAAISAAPGQVAWTREALEIQERMIELRRRTSSASGAIPDTTPWRAVSPTTLASVRVLTNATPGELLVATASSQAWAAMLGDVAWEQTLRVWTDDTDVAVGVVLLWDFKDDAVAGHDFRVSMQKTGVAWNVERIEDRYHCRRKVTANGQCG